MRVLLLAVPLFALSLSAREIPFVPDDTLKAITSELSGEMALRNLEGIAREHRMRGSKGYRAAAELVVAELERYGYGDARIEQFPANGTIFYGTQRSRPAWNAEFAELWETAADGRRIRLADWSSEPLTLAQDSISGEAAGLLVDVGAGTGASDYEGKEIKGRFVLTSSQPQAVVPLAVARHGAAGIISYAQNQPSAWWGEDENLIRWGHLDTFSSTPAFAFMTTLKQARAFQQRLRAGEEIRLEAVVRAEQTTGAYEIAMATLPGSDPSLAAEEIVYSCHLDHPRPGANDNASGCVAILEVARTLRKLIDEERIAPPLRTIRFVWPPEIEGTLALLNARPAIRSATKAAIHLDMVGGGPATKAMFHVTRGPASLPSFIYDLAAAVGEFANRETAAFSMTGSARFPMIANGGGKEALQARMVPLTLGSDHQVYSDSSFRIPSVYLNDWPDRYIHTNADTAANVDPTKLERAAFIAAMTGYALATLTADDFPAVWSTMQPAALRRAARVLELDPTERPNAARFASLYERETARSLVDFTGGTSLTAAMTRFLSQLDTILAAPPSTRPAGVVYRRNPSLLGPMSAFGYDYFTAHYGTDNAQKLRLRHHRGPRGLGNEYEYEALNLVDGRRSTSEIRDALSAIYGPVPLDVVEEYLAALASIEVITVASGRD
ncbi:MAG TPA: M28 family peptidase [Thermoanaerobaculia bacterium]